MAAGRLYRPGSAAWLAARIMRPITQLLRALAGTVASYREGDFSLSLVADRTDELGALMTAHNELAEALRTQRAHLVQRELLLDTVMQNSPVALVLVDAHERIAYGNIAARHLLSEGRSLNGLRFAEVLAKAPPALGAAATAQGDSLFSSDVAGVEETFHLSQRAFILQGRSFRLYLLKRLTRELSRQEVSTWKKLIGSEPRTQQLIGTLVLACTFRRRDRQTRRLFDPAGRIRGDRGTSGAPASFRQRLCGLREITRAAAGTVEWQAFAADLARQEFFRIRDFPQDGAGWFDRVQMEQALINLLKNAHEAGGAPSDVELSFASAGGEQRIEVCDRGSA